MSGDFEFVAEYIRDDRKATWVDLLEAVLQVLRRHGALLSPLAAFINVLPAKNESYLDYLWRLRKAFYHLHKSERHTQETRDLLVAKLSTHTPTIWLALRSYSRRLNNCQISEEAVNLAHIVARAAAGSPGVTIR
ncbi:hypothetical protein F4861DRAFT_512193 [Xylaria intraflava]|nr:hypothetical protein F4861DRAFT_512193 [Xylaria intraflava]